MINLAPHRSLWCLQASSLNNTALIYKHINKAQLKKVHYIELYGEDAFWHGRPARHGHLGKYRYWHYHTYVHDSVMNRALDVPTKNDVNYSQELRDKYMKERYVEGEAWDLQRSQVEFFWKIRPALRMDGEGYRAAQPWGYTHQRVSVISDETELYPGCLLYSRSRYW